MLLFLSFFFACPASDEVATEQTDLPEEQTQTTDAASTSQEGTEAHTTTPSTTAQDIESEEEVSEESE